MLEHLADFEGLSLEPSAKAALRLAEQATRDSNQVSDALFAELRQHFDEGQLVELLAVIGLFNYFNRFNNVLRMRPTAAGER